MVCGGMYLRTRMEGEGLRILRIPPHVYASNEIIKDPQPTQFRSKRIYQRK
jgi:hypothetical protein